MLNLLLVPIVVAVGFVLGIIGTLSFLHLKQSQKLEFLKNAEKELAEQKRLLIEKNKEEFRRKRSEFEYEIKKKEFEVKKNESAVQKKLDQLKEKEISLEVEARKYNEKNSMLEERILDIRIKEERTHNFQKTLVEQLEKISHMSKKEAKEQLMNLFRAEVEIENQQWLAKVEEDVSLKAKDLANRMVTTVMQRYASDQVALISSGVIDLPNEDIKGKIIGKEGRNIRSLEKETGMEFLIGDNSETITISGFNPIRKEVARKTLTALLQDGKINPTRIEELVAKSESEVNEMIEEAGRSVVMELGVSGVHREVVKLLGMLQFRTSYTQNILEHSKESAIFARMIAEELGLDGKLAARCGLLHDIGKAISHEVEGPHAAVGADFLKKYGENSVVVNAVAAHHGDVPPASIYAIITIIADTISASRPGARKETLAAYIKRLEQLEEIAKSFEGIKKAYALQAGRELRIIVDESSLDDAECYSLARNIAKKIQEEMAFPGQIKVNVIREKRCIEYAK